LKTLPQPPAAGRPPAVLRPSPGRRWAGRWLALGVALAAGLAVVRAELQFDVFVGYGSGGGSDGVVRESGWFPVACEVFNDGPGFDAVFEISARQLGGGQARRLAIELPTNTRKRFSFPVFAGSRYSSWDARLLDAKGKVRAERSELRTRDLGWETFLIGGLPNSFGGLPAFPPAKHNRPDQQPSVARLTVDQFPDNPISLEGLDALYLNSAKAPELKAAQAQALVAWVMGGGHLVVAPDQLTDITGTPWLAALLPVEFGDLAPARSGGTLQAWIAGGATLGHAGVPPGGQPPGFVPGPTGAPRPRGPSPAQPNPYSRLNPEAAFESAEFPIYTARVRDGEVTLALQGRPLVVTTPRGRGQVTALAFSPEREPFRSWANKPWFWARLFGVPGEWFGETARNLYGGWSLDAVFGAMIETRQVRKLPVEWLLALLLIYLVVIGPFDRWLLKRLNRQMLTWVTFPAYVVLFSLLIYYIGFRLRAGDTEWNEMHVVDVLPRGEQVALRGRTYASLYSSVNARYRLASDQPFAALRSEFLGPSGGRQEGARVDAMLKPAGFQAEVAVPVWSSLLYISDWEEPATAPVTAQVTSGAPGDYVIAVENRLPRPLGGLHLCVGDRVFALGEVAASQARTFRVTTATGQRLGDFLRSHQQSFVMAAQQRHRAFGGSQSGLLELSPAGLVAASLVGAPATLEGAVNAAGLPGQRSFVYPAGTDLTGLLARGEAVLFGWDPGHAPGTSSLARFKAPRTAQNTFFRLALPVGKEG
jgi:hypothetical protein